MLKKLLFLSFTFLSLILFSQHKSEKYNHHQLEVYLKAQEAYELHEFYSALNLFKSLDSLTGHNEHDYEIAVCYFHTRHWDEAELILKPFIVNKYNYPESIEFYWAVINHFNHDFETAKFFYSSYLTRLPHSKLHYDQIVSDIQHRISLCDIGKKMVIAEKNVIVRNLGAELNTPFLDYGPIWLEDKGHILFTSERPSTTGGEIDLTDGTYNEDIYYVTHPSERVWYEAKKIEGEIDSKSNESILATSEDHSRVLIYKYDRNHFYSKSSGDLYEAKLESDSLFDLVKFPKNINSKYWESGACYVGTSDLIIVSDRPGGQGGSDLYLVKKTSKGWEKPVNLGTDINTSYDEDSPYITPDGKYLFFASKGHDSMGGFDVFCSEKGKDGKWGTPINLGYPINTAHDEMYFSLNKELTKMYLSSDRKGGHGDQDIYFIESTEGTRLVD